MVSSRNYEVEASDFCLRLRGRLVDSFRLGRDANLLFTPKVFDAVWVSSHLQLYFTSYTLRCKFVCLFSVYITFKKKILVCR